MRRLLLCLIWCLLACVHARAATTYYVAVSGNDFNPGTSSQPFATIQKGLTTAATGDTVIVNAGTYAGAGNRDLTFGGKSITLQSASGPNATIIECGGVLADNHRGFVFTNNETSAAVVQGFTVTHGFQSGGDPAGAAAYINNSSPTFRSCIFSDNTISNTGGGNSYGGAVLILSGIGAISPSFTNCIFTRNEAISNSLPAAGAGLFAVGGTSTSPVNLTITNCTFSGNILSGSSAKFGCAVAAINYVTITAKNSIFYGDTGAGELYIQSPATATVTYSDVQGGYSGTGNLDVDPLFVSSTNLQLQKTSPAVDSGTNSGAPATDLLGVTRPQALRTDMGAYEFNAYTESLVVTTLDDENNGTSDSFYGTGTSLREAIIYANKKAGDDTISFANGLSGTIALTSALPILNSNISFTGPGASALTIARSSANGIPSLRLFNVAAGKIVSFAGLTLANGASSNNGGAIYNSGQTSVSRCVFLNNSAVGGGAISNDLSEDTLLDITSCTFTGNSASGGVGGGALLLQGNNGVATVTNSTFNGNSANNAGGAIRNSGGSTCTLKNSTLSGNSANNVGGAIYNDSTLTVANCTFTGNRADADGNNPPGVNGGGINSPVGNATLTNSIVAGNLTGTGTTPDDIGGTITNASYNLIGNASSSGSITDGTNGNKVGVNGSGTRAIATILDTTLANNGGPTYTHALLGGSPALNAGDPAFDPNNFTPALTTDQRGSGYPRVQGGRLDIGAYEARLLSLNDPTITEGNSGGTTNLDFTISLSSPATQVVTVQYATQDGTATAPADYTATTGTVTFNPGQSSQTVSVPIQGDVLDETNEKFYLNLSNATGDAILFDNQGTMTINDDDAPPSISINDVSVNETNGGSAQAQLTLTLSAPSNLPISVIAQSSSSAGSPVATAGTDYLSAPAATITFAPGQTAKTFNVTILGDTIDENDEKFAVSLSGATNATVSDNTGVVTIIDNDDPPTVSVSAPNTTEGNTGDTPIMTFTISLSAASARNISVQYQTANASTFPATSGTDYTAVPPTTVIFAPGETTKTVNVTVKGDVLDEDNERIKLNLQNPVNATLGTISEGIIVDDDATPELSINDVQVQEGNSGTKLMTFTVTLSAATGRTVTVNAATGNGGSPAATADTDYTALASTPITFTPGQTSKQISVAIYGDTTVEVNEKLAVILSGAVNATLADNSGIGTIVNDDATPLLAPAETPSGGEDEK